MGNKFPTLRKSEAAKAAPDKAGRTFPVSGRLANRGATRGGEGQYGI